MIFKCTNLKISISMVIYLTAGIELSLNSYFELAVKHMVLIQSDVDLIVSNDIIVNLA